MLGTTNVFPSTIWHAADALFHCITAAKLDQGKGIHWTKCRWYHFIIVARQNFTWGQSHLSRNDVQTGGWFLACCNIFITSSSFVIFTQLNSTKWRRHDGMQEVRHRHTHHLFCKRTVPRQVRETHLPFCTRILKRFETCCLYIIRSLWKTSKGRNALQWIEATAGLPMSLVEGAQVCPRV